MTRSLSLMAYFSTYSRGPTFLNYGTCVFGSLPRVSVLLLPAAIVATVSAGGTGRRFVCGSRSTSSSCSLRPPIATKLPPVITPSNGFAAAHWLLLQLLRQGSRLGTSFPRHSLSSMPTIKACLSLLPSDAHCSQTAGLLLRRTTMLLEFKPRKKRTLHELTGVKILLP